MPATFVNAGTGVFTIDGVDYSCQVTGFDPGWRDATPDRTASDLTACGDTIPPDRVEDYPARPALSFVHDWSADGVSTALAGNVGETVDLVVDLDTDKPDHARHYVGSVILPPVPDEWTPGKLQRADRYTMAAVTLTGPTAGASPAADPASGPAPRIRPAPIDDPDTDRA